MVFTASLLSAQHKRDHVENKLASLLVVCLDKTPKKMPPSLYGKQMAGPMSLLIVVAHSTQRLAKRDNEKPITRKASLKIKDLAHIKKNKNTLPMITVRSF